MRSQTRICGSFDFENKEDAIRLLIEFYRREIRGTERDTDEIQGYVSEVVDWFMNGSTRGLLMVGNVGCGKTSMLNAICKMFGALYYSNSSIYRKGFQWETAYKVAEWCGNDTERYEGFKKCEWCAIDDIGQEPAETLIYGNTIYPIRDILLYRYDHDLVTIVTTNLNPKSLTERYGIRIGDRLQEMMHVIKFKNKSYRR